MKYKIRKIIGTIFILIGVCLISITGFMKYETYKKQQKSLESFKNMDSYSEADEGEENTENGGEKTAIAVLKIPKINLEVAVVQGVEKEDIKYVVGHFKDSVMPGEVGNLCVAGHRTSNYGQPFKEVDKLQQGDEIIFTYNGGEYVYTVNDSFVVTPYDTYILDNTEDEATMTLITCTMDSKNRLIIKGTLKQ